MPRATSAGSSGRHSTPSGPAGLPMTTRRISGKSLATTGTPAARHSNSLFGVER